MDWIQHAIGYSIIEALGWTLVHSVWQICIWAILAVTVLVITRKSKAKIRYIALTIIFLGICFGSAVTFKNYYLKADIKGESNFISLNSNEPKNDILRTNQSKLEQVQNNNLTLISWFKSYFDKHLQGIATIWFLGFVFLFFRYIGGIVWLIRLKHTSELITNKYEETLFRLCRKMKMRNLVDIGRSIRIQSPIVIGHFKPLILFPVKILTGLTNEQLESILIHELAHVKRNDYFINLLQSFVEIVFFYHPAVWWLSASIRTEREHACDDLAISRGIDPLSMAQTIASLTELTLKAPQFSQAFLGKQHKIKNRINRLIFTEKMKTNLSQKVIVALAIMLSVVILSFTSEKASNLIKAKSESANPIKTLSVDQKVNFLEYEKPNDIKINEEQNETSSEGKQTIAAKSVEEKAKIKIKTKEYSQILDNVQDDDDDSGQTLKTLIKKGAKEWNKYRDNHSGENFDEILKEINLSGFDFKNFNLSYINLKEATLVNCNFTNANMTGVNIKEADVKGAVFEKANLTNANMKELTLNNINLKHAILMGANLKEIVLNNCDFSGANLVGTVMHEAEIKNCNFKGASADHTTTFPPGFDWAKEGIIFK